jgi:hypothetical protein
MENQLVTHRGGGKPLPLSFCAICTNLAAREGAPRAELPLYHTAHKKSIDILHKLSPDLFPEFVQFDENFF